MAMEKRQLWTLEDKQISHTNQPFVQSSRSMVFTLCILNTFTFVKISLPIS